MKCTVLLGHWALMCCAVYTKLCHHDPAFSHICNFVRIQPLKTPFYIKYKVRFEDQLFYFIFLNKIHASENSNKLYMRNNYKLYMRSCSNNHIFKFSSFLNSLLLTSTNTWISLCLGYMILFYFFKCQ